MIHVPEATARELMNLSTENEDQVNSLYLETIETMPPYVLPNQTKPNHTKPNHTIPYQTKPNHRKLGSGVYIWKLN